MIVMTIFALVNAWAGASMLSAATGIAGRRKSNVWAVARPELGASLLFFVMAIHCAAVAGGWL